MALESYIFGILIAFLMGIMFARKLAAGVGIEAYKNQLPQLDLRTYLNGRWKTYGLVEDVSGRIVTRFSGTLQAEWQGNDGSVTEELHYENGTVERNHWKLHVNDSGELSGSADHIDGEIQGKQRGHSMRRNYRWKREVNAKSLIFVADEWMHYIDAEHYVSKLRLRKFGITTMRMLAWAYKE